MNKAQRRAHVEPTCPKCGGRVIPIWKDERSPTATQPDWNVSDRQCSERDCSLNDPNCFAMFAQKRALAWLSPTHGMDLPTEVTDRRLDARAG
jgi:hypothetical protein